MKTKFDERDYLKRKHLWWMLPWMLVIGLYVGYMHGSAIEKGPYPFEHGSTNVSVGGHVEWHCWENPELAERNENVEADAWESCVLFNPEKERYNETSYGNVSTFQLEQRFAYFPECVRYESQYGEGEKRQCWEGKMVKW